MLKKAVERGTLPISRTNSKIDKTEFFPLDLETEFASVKYDGIPGVQIEEVDN